MKKFFVTFLILFLVLFTAIIKNSTKRIDDEIFSLKENIRESKRNFENIKLEHDYLSSTDKLLDYQNLYFDEELFEKDIQNFYVIYQNRENKAVQFVKKYLKKNKKDKIVSVNLSLFWSRPQSYYKNWHGKWKSDGGVLAQQGAHYIDLLCYLFGKPLKAIALLH